MKVAEDRSRKRNNSTEDKASLVQSIIVDTWYITDNTIVENLTGWRASRTINQIIMDIYQWIEANSSDLSEILN